VWKPAGLPASVFALYSKKDVDEDENVVRAGSRAFHGDRRVRTDRIGR
jgi:hypothetical protein